MSRRVKREDLERALGWLNTSRRRLANQLGCRLVPMEVPWLETYEERTNWVISGCHLGWLVEVAGGSYSISPRLPKRELYEWMRIFQRALDLATDMVIASDKGALRLASAGVIHSLEALGSQIEPIKVNIHEEKEGGAS